VLTRVRHLSLSWARWIQITAFCPVSLILVTSSHVPPRFLNWPVSLPFRAKILCAFLISPVHCHPSNFLSFTYLGTIFGEEYKIWNHLYGLEFRVPGYRSRGPVFFSRGLRPRSFFIQNMEFHSIQFFWRLLKLCHRILGQQNISHVWMKREVYAYSQSYLIRLFKKYIVLILIKPYCP
jgi:hypothetical protein